MQATAMETIETKPFLKWVGGKQQLLDQFAPMFPTSFRAYHEPFLGGGAVYYHLWNTGRINDVARLSDLNTELINAYVAVRDSVDDVIDILALHERKHDHEYYYRIRALDRGEYKLSCQERAARLIYLNRTCYNGLYRVNRKGQFNVPIGSYRDPKILFEETLRSASKALHLADLGVRGFDSVVELAERGDFIYFDPPYVPVSKTSSFTSYTLDSFDEASQRRLAEIFTELDAKGCFCMLSNSFSSLVMELYKRYRIEIVSAIRAVNSNGKARGAINEVVVLNY